jgi:hypothetical protein
MFDISLPIAFRKNRVALPLPFRQRDLNGPFELSPLEGQIECAAEATKSAIDAGGRERRMLGSEVLSVLVADLVQRLRGPIALTNHVSAVRVILRRARLGRVLRLHERDEIGLQEVGQRRYWLLLANAY